MKVEYRCEICGRRYLDPMVAARCELQGEPEPIVPMGTIIGAPQRRGHHTWNMTFVITKTTLEGHYRHYSGWGFRDNGAGDDVDEAGLCDGLCGPLDPPRNEWPDPNHPTFKRALAAIRKHGMEPRVWNGNSHLPLRGYKRWWNHGRL